MLETLFREEKSIYIKYWSQIIGHFINNKSVEHPLVKKNIYLYIITNANMLETTHRDTNANLYPMHTF